MEFTFTPNTVPKCDSTAASPGGQKLVNGKPTLCCNSRLFEFTLFVKSFHLSSRFCTFEEEV